MYRAISVARYVINYSNDINRPVSNLKLQKLLYYIQAAFLTEYSKKCFSDDIIAWEFGPVIPEVYQNYRVYGRDNIPSQEEEREVYFNFDTMKIQYKESKIIEEQEAEIIQRVINGYAAIDNPFDLVKKTHKEAPWKNTVINNIIKCEDIKKYYAVNRGKIYNF